MGREGEEKGGEGRRGDVEGPAKWSAPGPVLAVGGPAQSPTAWPKIVCFLTQSVQLTLSSVQLTLLECVM